MTVDAFRHKHGGRVALLRFDISEDSVTHNPFVCATCMRNPPATAPIGRAFVVGVIGDTREQCCDKLDKAFEDNGI